MLKFDFTNFTAEAVGKDGGLTKADVEGLNALVPAAHNKFQDWRKSGDAIFYDIVSDPSLTLGIQEKATEVMSSCTDVVVLGIGGSALGLRSISQALLPPFWNIIDSADRNSKPRLFVCDNIDPETFSSLLNLVEFKKTCFVVISKSGRTTETQAQFLVVLDRLRRELGNSWRKHLVIITDPASGELRPMVKKENLSSFAIHPKLGGRFSALSPVGLFPAACVGIDINALLYGARTMARRCTSESLDENPAYHIGGAHYWFDAKKKKPMHVMIPYCDALNLFSDWYAQLMAESLGKCGHGPTPIKALGATDQHSQVQLYMEGPGDKVFTFIGVETFRIKKSETQIKETSPAFDYIAGHDLGSILLAEQRATAAALRDAGRPNITITIPSIDAHHIGELFMLYEIATAFAGALYGINPFDQPGVELGKKLTREILSKN